MKKPTRARPLLAYVGSYTTPERHGDGDGINVYRVDRRTGAFTHLQRLGGLENPSFLAVNADGTRLYSVHGDRSEINSFTIDPAHRPTGAAQPPADRRLQSRPSRLRCDRPLPRGVQLRHRFARRLPACGRRQPAALSHPHHRDRHARPASHPAAHHVRAPHSARRPRPLLLRAVQGLRRRHRLSPRHQAEDPGRGGARDGAAGRRAAPYRFPPRQGAGLRHQRARFDDHHLPPGSAKRRAHAAADDPGHAVGVHRLQHGRRDLGRSRRPQCLRLQSRPRQHRRVRHRSAARARCRRASGCRPMAARRASSPSIPTSASSTSPTRTAARSWVTASAAMAGSHRPASG